MLHMHLRLYIVSALSVSSAVIAYSKVFRVICGYNSLNNLNDEAVGSGIETDWEFYPFIGGCRGNI